MNKFIVNVMLSLTALLMSAHVQAERPNVVIMVADDLGYADMGFVGSEIETPSLDRLAAEGAHLKRFYTTPICSPTRAALMTGRNPQRLGVAYGVILPWDTGGIHGSEKFLSESFQDAGYQTAMFGKWHLGHAQQQFHPNSRGFDEFYGHLHTEVGFYPPFSNLGGKDFQRNGVSIDDKGYETDLLADKAIEWIAERDKDKPFFLYMPFLAPHEPLEAPDHLVEKYQHLKDERGPARSPSDNISKFGKMMGQESRRPLYAAVVDAMDQAVGRVLAELDRQGIADNTIVIFFSDNGATRVFGRGGGDNAPLRGGKAEVYEGGIRVASLMRWPEKIQGGLAYDEIISVMDLFPTLMAATGVEPGKHKTFDGINVLPALLANKKPKRKDNLFFASEIPRYGSFNFTVFNDEWKLVQFVEQDPLSISVKNELYRIKDDVGEYNDLSAQHPKVVEELAEEILKWRALYPMNGTRARISAPPGWRAPKDWANYPMRSEELQPKPATSMAPTPMTERLLDFMLEGRGRLIYDCDPWFGVGGLCFPE